MARRLGVGYPGAIHHRMNRGDRWEAIFPEDRDPEVFIATHVEERHRAPHYGGKIRQIGRAKAERLVAEELRTLGWKETDLAARRKGDPGKLKLAIALRSETTMTLGWIATRPHMGTGPSLSNLLQAHRRGDAIMWD